MVEARPDSMIFDMDGTLWDAVATYTKAWNVYFASKNIKLSVTKEFLDSLMGLEESKYLAEVIPQFDPAARKSIYERVIELQYELIDTEGGVLYADVVAELKKLSSKYKLFIVSNCPEFTIKHFIKWAKIEEYITDSLAHGQNYQAKSHNIGLIINKHQLRNPIYIGDTDSDRKQSELAGLPFVFMEYGFGSCDKYHRKFASFTEFSAFYQEL